MKSKLQLPGSHAHRHTFTEDLDLRPQVHKNNSEFIKNTAYRICLFTSTLADSNVDVQQITVEKSFLVILQFSVPLRDGFPANNFILFLSGVIDSEQFRELKIIFSVIQQNPLRFE